MEPLGETLVLRPRRWPGVVFLVAGLLFLVAGAALAPSDTFLGVACLGGGLVFSFLGFVRLHPNASRLELNREGFILRDFFRDALLVPWTSVREFRPGTQFTAYSVIYSRTDQPARRRRCSCPATRAERIISGGFGLDAPTFAALLNRWRERAAAGAVSPPPV